MSKIKILLEQGENEAVEFKSASVSSERLAKEIVAFANTQGGSILMGVEELLRMFQQAGVFHFDATGVYKTKISDLNWSKLDKFFEQYEIDYSNEIDKQRLLVNTDIMAEDGKVSVAGLLVFGINPQKYLYNASISFAHFAGNDLSDELIDKQVIEGTLDYQIDTCLAVIKNNIKHPSIIEGAKTVDTVFLYPDRVFREIIVNACLHRNYAITGSSIRVFLFENRLEVRSPGRLPNSVTIEKMKAGVSFALNPVLLKFMQNLRYIDKLGRGIPMVNRIAQQNNKQLILEEIGEEFVLILSF